MTARCEQRDEQRESHLVNSSCHAVVTSGTCSRYQRLARDELSLNRLLIPFVPAKELVNLSPLRPHPEEPERSEGVSKDGRESEPAAMVRDGAHRSQVYAGCACYGAPPHHEVEREVTAFDRGPAHIDVSQSLAGTSLGMCCEQFQSHASTVNTIAWSRRRKPTEGFKFAMSSGSVDTSARPHNLSRSASA